MSSTNLPTVCIIGAGPSGITTAKRLQDHGIPFDCFEASDEVGGNWYYKNPNGMSACYQSLHIDTSKWRLAFEDFPVPPAEWPDFPHHSLLFQYFKDYVAHFGLRDKITFNTSVDHAERGDDGLWTVTLSTGETRAYDALIVCNGHHWDPNTPPDYPGQFDGTLMHSHEYNDPFDPIDMRGKNVVVVGMGNSGLDIASELSQRFLAKKLTVSARRGVWSCRSTWAARPATRCRRRLDAALALARAEPSLPAQEHRNHGGLRLPKPDHQPFEAHPSASGEFLGKAGSGDISFKPAITALEASRCASPTGAPKTST